MKNTLYCLMAVTAVLCTASGCFRNDVRTVTFQINQLRSPEAASILVQAVRNVAGVTEVRPDLQKNALIVVWNGRDSGLKNIETAISSAGFDLPDRPAAAADKARLPEGLRK